MSLAGTAWVLKPTTSILNGSDHIYNLTHYVEGTMSNYITTDYSSNCGDPYAFNPLYVSISARFAGGHTYIGRNAQDWVCPSTPTTMTGMPFIIYIEGGSDATNSTLESWFNANATRLITYDLSQLGLNAGLHTISTTAKATNYVDSSVTTLLLNIYTLSATITNGSITGVPSIAYRGDGFSGLVSATSGYALPSTLTVSGATLSSYNDTTGAYVITNVTSNVSITGTCLEILPTPSNASLSNGEISFDTVQNADSYDVYSDGVLIGTITEE